MSPPRSPELRRDAVFGRWVAFSPARSHRPSDLKSTAPASAPNPNPAVPACPFCRGREAECAPEIFRRPAAAAADWTLRVIENLYPALRRDLPLPQGDAEEEVGPGRWAVEGFGFHDVVIETPWHGVNLVDLSVAEVGEVVLAYKQRVEQLAQHESIKYVQVFKNHGASAGASMSHSHSQIMGLPLVPPTVSARLENMKEHFDRTGKCSLCEVKSDDILVHESSYFFSIAPFAAQYPFEIWVVPRDHTSHFHQIDKEKAVDFGGLLKLMLLKLSQQLHDPPFNFMVHTAPLELPSSSSPYTHWFLQIIPQLNRVAGFEIGSGCFINPVFPEDAAKVLRDVNVN